VNKTSAAMKLNIAPTSAAVRSAASVVSRGSQFNDRFLAASGWDFTTGSTRVGADLFGRDSQID
jgi:hypothetical protein